ncbi:MAG TPA: glycoside hydrolase family 125 protein, partial [Bacteroidales bacterium]|nr:glycoside hydrolase family 125 protein [Bacteroidales bacterium]
MSSRRKFIRNSMMAGVALSAGIPSFVTAGTRRWPSARPPVRKRKFRSKAVEETIREIESFLGSDNELAWLFSNCFPNTLDTTVTFSEKEGRPDTFV